MHRSHEPLLAALALLASTGPAVAQGSDAPTIEDRLDRLEQENAQLRERLDIVSGEVERTELRDLFPEIGDARNGLGPAASKVYGQDRGLSIGGYGEGTFTSESGAKDSTADLLRGIIYTGYKFDDRWLFNSELEVEHASTEDAGAVSLEFAYLDYMSRESLNARFGLVLVPMGFINEMHEPTTFLSVNRPETERRIIPSTWRENGVGVYGDAGGFSYRGYVINGFDADGFSAEGLRDGRQDGSKAKANDLAVTARLDWTDTPGVLAGASVYFGNSGQETAGFGSVGTSLVDVHFQYEHRGWWFRALAAAAKLDDTAQLNAAKGLTGTSVIGDEMLGYYGELGYDLMAAFSPESGRALTPYVRYERVNTQESVAVGMADPTNDETIVSFGVAFQPIDEIVFKTSFEDFDNAPDRFSLSLGYVF
ncbi:MAG: hypothetical protein H6831_15805 [Planctomycetes bacterium]|nr:hypothetical protein [Planctomycetota bacterium]